MTMMMIPPFSGAPEQQDLIPLGGNQEFSRRRDLGWSQENQGIVFRARRRHVKKPRPRKCLRTQMVGPTWPNSLTVCATLFRPSWLFPLRSFSYGCSLGEKPAVQLSTPKFLSPDACYAIHRNPRITIFVRHNRLDIIVHHPLQTIHMVLHK